MHLVQQLNNWAVWAVPNPRKCPCHGRGWLVSDFDTLHACGLHGGTPHPEDEDGAEHFDYEGHRLTKMREAFVTYREMSGMDNATFKATVVREAPEGATPQQFVDAAEGVGETLAREARETDARANGYTCDLERRWEEDALLEQRFGPDY